MMRTTLNVADDILAAARTLASERGTSVGQALSEMARRGLRPPLGKDDSGIPVFQVDDDAPLITPEMVERALDEL